MKRPFLAFVITLLTAVASVHAATARDLGYAATGDVHRGVQVIRDLEVDDLPPGTHKYYFLAGARSTGQPLYVPVLVVKGHMPGKRLTLTAAVHGDELNGIAVIHLLLAQIDPAALSGTILAVPGVNQTGMTGNSRHFLSSGGGGSQSDPNRIFPGTLSGGSTAERFIGTLWHGLLKGNTDIAVDLHTQTTGSRYPLFVFADFRNDVARTAAFALMPDIIKNDSGQKGTLETTYLKAEIPAVTFEVGGPKQFEPQLIKRATEGLLNLMRQQGMVQGEIARSAMRPFVGSSYTNVQVEEAGTAQLKVKLLDEVEKGQLIAVVLDPFGEELRRYFAPHGGRVLAVATDPLREAGAMLVRIIR